MVAADELRQKGSSALPSSPATFLKACSGHGRGCRAPACVEIGKGKAAAKCELVDYNSLPNYMKDNQFILFYYRAEWPLKQTILSIFSLHNETLNIWTHLVGFFVFLALMACATMVLRSTCYQAGPSPSGVGAPASSGPDLRLPDRTNGSSFAGGAADSSPPCIHRPQFFPCIHGSAARSGASAISAASNRTEGIGKKGAAAPAKDLEPAPRWPFFTYLLGAMTCLLVSSVCHLLSCHSRRFLYIMRGLDYTGITVLIVTSFYPVVYYSFMCDALYRHLYLGLITASGLAMVGISLLPSFQGPRHRMLRAGLFFCMGVSGVVPIMHKAVRFRDREAALVTTGYEAAMGALYVMATAVYAARVPERWLPGRFDLLGQSHHFFHVLVMAAAYTHYLGSVVYLQWRDSEGC